IVTIMFISFFCLQLIAFRIISSALGIVLLFALEFYRKKFVAHKSMRLLMDCHAFWTLFICICVLVDHSMAAFSRYTAKIPTDILLTTAQCLPRRLLGAIALYGSVTSMLAMAMERRSASQNCATYEQTGRSSGYLYSLFHLVIALTFGGILWATYGYNSRTPHCTIVTPQGLIELNIINVVLFIMEISTIVIFAALLRRNQMSLQQAKFKISLTERALLSKICRHQLTENIRMLKLFLPVVGTHTSLTLAGLIAFFGFQLSGLGVDYYPMFEDSINFIYLQGIFMPIIFLFRYR
ncbi:hypothetical protein PENTCL1PPCAC_21975, partial [Pristionchus entomophagus]